MNKRNVVIALIFVNLFLSSFFLNAQSVELSRSALINKKWKMIDLTDKMIEEVYSPTKIESYYNGNFFCESIYYLSDKIDTVFVEANVGNAIKGKYIICRLISAENDNFTVLEVISVSDSALTLRNVKHTHLLRFGTN